MSGDEEDPRRAGRLRYTAAEHRPMAGSISSTVFGAVRGLTPRWLRRRLPRPLKRWLRRRALGYTPFDFADEAFDATAGPEDVYYCYRLLLGRHPDPEGWKTYEAAVRDGRMPAATLVADFLASPEFRRRARAGDPAAPRPVLVDLGDFRMYVAPDDFDVGQALLAHGRYEPHVAAALRRHLEPGGVFVDVGAHVGYFSLLAASLVGAAGRVVSVEPSHGAAALLWASARLNGFRQLELYPFAVAEARRLFALAGRGGHTTLVEWDDPIGAAPGPAPASLDAATPGPALTVSVTLDELLGDAARVDLIKLDIEGAEARALAAAGRTLARHRPVIVTEFAPAALQNVSRVSGDAYLTRLVEAGYDLAVLEADGAPRPAGGDLRPILAALARHPSPRIEVVALPR